MGKNKKKKNQQTQEATPQSNANKQTVDSQTGDDKPIKEEEKKPEVQEEKKTP